METKYDYQSVATALAKLNELGYAHDFNIDFDELFFYAEDYTIDYLYRYEGITDPSDESTVYGLRNLNSGKKGVFVVGDLSLVEGKKREIIINLEIRSKHQKE